MTNIQENPPISDSLLAEYWFRIRHNTFQNILDCFKVSGLKQTDIASRLGRDPGQISRILKGRQNVTLRTLSDIARAIDCRLIVGVEPLHTIRKTNHYFGCDGVGIETPFTVNEATSQGFGTLTPNNGATTGITSSMITISSYNSAVSHV